MKYFYLTVLLCIALHFISLATTKIWIGPVNGNWSNPANWSDGFNGPVSTVSPSMLDEVSIGGNAIIHVDQPVVISVMNAGTVTLYASTSIQFRILTSLNISYQSTLKDSTSENVLFNMVLDGAAGARATVNGNWVFEGRVPVNRLIAGAAFIAEPGSQVTVSSNFNYNANTGRYEYGPGAQVILKKNAGTIVSDKTSLRFLNTTNFILDDNLDAMIPSATWGLGEIIPGVFTNTTVFSATIQIKNNIGKLAYPEAPALPKLVVDLPALSSDASLNLPNSTSIGGNLNILNTNGHTLTLLSTTSPSSLVSVYVGSAFTASGEGGYFNISGSNTKVALATATPETAGTNYSLGAGKGFSQSGGNFSLQDFNGATGSSTLSISGNLYQNGGSFYTNSSSTMARFAVVMVDPFRPFPGNTTPEIYFSYVSYSFIGMSSGTIDNASHNVILRIDHLVHTDLNILAANGVILSGPLSVGRLELVGSPLTTTAENILTINNPAPNAVSTSPTIGQNGQNASFGYVNGPLRRATNSTVPYLFPTGKGNKYQSTADYTNYKNSFHNDSCYIIPASGTASMYQAEYFETGYPDSSVSAPLAGVSTTKYWNVSKVSGADASVQLLLHDPLPGAKAADSIVTANYNGRWTAANGTVLSPGNVTTGTVTSKPFSTGGLYTFGYLDGAPLTPVPGTVFNGLHYKYYEGGYRVMPDFNTLTPVKTGNSADFDLNIRRSGINDSFAIVWEGYINIPAPGLYTFQTVSDDGSKFYFNSLYNPNGVALVDNDSTHAARTVSGTINIPAAGRYPVTVTYFENAEREQLQVYWEGPGIRKQPIPAAAFTDSVIQPVSGGLNYKYYEGAFNTLADLAGKTPVKTGISANVDISVRPPAVNDNFAFTWEGKISIPATGTYTFETISDDGSRLVINGVAVVTNDGLHAPTSVTGSITLVAGVYPISISYFEKDGGETMQVYWSGPGMTRQMIPNSAFMPESNPPTDGLSYKYYEVDLDFLNIQNFNTFIPTKTGTSANIDISVRNPGRNDHFAFLWEGNINITTPGTYTFTTISDDGSKFYFNSLYDPNGIPLIDNDGIHASRSISRTINIPTAGSYPISLTYFERDGGEAMQLYWSGPGIPMQLIPNSAFSKANAPVTGGLNYKYFEGSFSTLPNFTALTPVKTGISPNVDISLRTQGRNDNFAFLWEGYIKIPSAGVYTFETVSDDGSRLYFNTLYDPAATPTVDNDGVHSSGSATGMVNVPAAGVYPISITFFDKDGGENMQVYWSGPGISRQLIPSAAFTQSATPNGLNYKYYEGTWNALPDFTALTPVKTGFASNLDLGLRTAGRNDNFAFLWEGYLTTPVPGNFTFELVSDDGSKFYFDKFYSPSAVPLINNDGLHPATSVTGYVTIGSTIPIAITYFERDGGETLQLYWSAPGLPRQLVPASAFSLLPPVPATASNRNVTEVSGIAEDLGKSTITKVYPNPFGEQFNISFYNNKANDDISIAIYDLNGKQLYSQHKGHFAQGNTTMTVNLKDKQLKDGIYLVAVSVNGIKSKTVKLIKHR